MSHVKVGSVVEGIRCANRRTSCRGRAVISVRPCDGRVVSFRPCVCCGDEISSALIHCDTG